MGVPKKEIEIDDLIEEPGVGHNSLSKKELMDVITKVENLLEERSGINEAIKDVYVIAKSKGLEPKIIKKCVTARAKGLDAWKEEQELIDLYLVACGLA